MMNYQSAQSRLGQVAVTSVGVLGFGVAILLLSTLAVLSPKWGVLLTLGLASFIAAMSLPLVWLVTAELVLATVIAGCLEYFAHSTQGFWAAAGLPLLLALRAVLAHSARQTRLRVGHVSPEPPRSALAHWVLVSLVVYLLTLLFSAVMNQSPPLQVLVAAKNYVFVWAMLYVFLRDEDFAATSSRFWRLIIWTGVLQLPVVLYQRLFVASKLGNSAAGLSWDAVSGTFGGGLLGGRSAAMAMFIMMAVAYLMIRWRDRQLAGWRAFGLVFLMMPAIFLAEVKMVVIWLAFIGFMVFGRDLLRRPAVAVLALLVMLGLSVGIVFAYLTMYYEGSYTSSADLFEKQIGYIFDVNRFNAVTREIGRIASIYFWWTQNQHADITTLMMGSGPGASRSFSSIAVGEIAARYSYYLDTSTLTALLWDTGLIGAFGFVAFGLLAMLAIWRGMAQPDISVAQRQQMEASLIGLMLIYSGFAYNRDAVDSLAIQLLLVFFVAVALRWSPRLPPRFGLRSKQGVGASSSRA